jgi:hypothetical protein
MVGLLAFDDSTSKSGGPVAYPVLVLMIQNSRFEKLREGSVSSWINVESNLLIETLWARTKQSFRSRMLD